MRFHLIAGLPASGKTHYAESIVGNGILVDDPKSLTSFWSSIKQHVSNDDSVIITDPNFCYDRCREGAEALLNKGYPGCEIGWTFFENDPEQCLRNAVLRPDKKVDQFIRDATKHYKIPEGATIRSVYRP